MNKYSLLVLGGTQMLGRDFVETLSNDTHYNITLANRGITNPDLFPILPRIKIDRNDKASCSALFGTSFDFIVDFSCYNINQFKNTFDYLSYKKYILISTQSVLEKEILLKANESDPYYHYCLLKKQLEDNIFSNENISSILIARPSAVYGDHDYTNRFEKIENDFYWKYHKVKASKDTGCVSVKDVTNQLIKLLSLNPKKRVTIYDII